ncbi:hypothetical protein FVER53590_28409 [Fusarium verticillioides]|nr:hypothetical protein FVER53263_20365 [Fusarium verticillioides]RBR10157.1 hypothetical protein FVER53590_28409 [Fusarium verticillioides]
MERPDGGTAGQQLPMLHFDDNTATKTLIFKSSLSEHDVSYYAQYPSQAQGSENRVPSDKCNGRVLCAWCLPTVPAPIVHSGVCDRTPIFCHKCVSFHWLCTRIRNP